MDEYNRPEIREFGRMASIQEAECYTDRVIKPYVLHPVKTRVQEICEFAKKMGYRKLGVAFRARLHPKAKALTKILTAQGFEVASVVCKTGDTPKEYIGLKDHKKMGAGEFESMCSPLSRQSFLTRRRPISIFS